MSILKKPSPNLKLDPSAKGRRSHGKATLADVAREAGVTTMTVSRFLREPHRVASHTAQRVQMAISSSGYMPNKQAGLLASGRSNIVAAIIPNIANSIFSETIQGLSDALQPGGFELLLASSGYSAEREEKQIRAVLGWAPFALVVTGRHHTAAGTQLLRAALTAGTPVVEMWDLRSPTQEFVRIGFDHKAAGASMAEHLIDCGYRDLAYVDSGVSEDFRAHERGDGFLEKASQHGAQVRVIRAPADEPMAAGRQVFQKLKSQGLPRAVAFANDQLAAGALMEAQDCQINVPETLALLGFGDFPIARQLSGGISTMVVPRYQIGEAAGQWIISCRLAGGAQNEEAPLSTLQPYLIRRRTT